MRMRQRVCLEWCKNLTGHGLLNTASVLGLATVAHAACEVFGPAFAPPRSYRAVTDVSACCAF
jgi:hypothetical protein